MKYQITNIHRNFSRNKDTPLEYLFYAKLIDENNKLIIYGTLEYILLAIKERKYILVDDV